MQAGTTSDLGSAAPIFAALGDQTRLLIVSRLCASGPMSITRLTPGSHVTRQAITKHLHVLRQAGFVRACKHGREQLWELTPHQLLTAHAYLDLISHGWDDTLDRFRTAIEGH